MAVKKQLSVIKLTPQIRDSMLKEVHDAIHHDGIMTKMDDLIESFKEYKEGRERKEIGQLKKAIEDQAVTIRVQGDRKKERNRFWLWVIGFFLGNEIFWKYAIPFVEKWINKLAGGE